MSVAEADQPWRRISVDAGAQPGTGIGRYLSSLLPRMVALRPGREWILHARAAGDAPRHAESARVRTDGMPANAGRILSLATSQPAWLMRDRPDLFWGPAHRLPLHVPRDTACVVTIHDLCWRREPGTMRRTTRWLDALLMPAALRRADRIIAVSHATRRDLAAAFPWAAPRIVTVHEAAEALPDVETARDAAVLGDLGIRRRYVLFVGTLEPRKNLTRLMQAFARLEDDVDLVLAGGPGWRQEAPADLANRFGITHRVIVPGRVDDAGLAVLYRNARMLALPSLYEGFGLPLLEALASGTPVLHGDNSSMPEVAGDAGLAVDARSVESIADGLRRLLSDAPLHALLAGKARARAAVFSWERAARDTLDVFDAAVASRRAARGRRVGN